MAAQKGGLWGNGAFTKALVEGLGGKAALLGNGTISLSELDAFVAETLAVNHEMRRVFAAARFPTTHRFIDGIVETRMDLREETT